MTRAWWRRFWLALGVMMAGGAVIAAAVIIVALYPPVGLALIPVAMAATWASLPS